MININLRDVKEIIEKKEREGISFREAAISFTDKDDEPYVPVRPLPCVRDEHGEIKEQPVYRLWGKVDEELEELKQALFISKYFSNMHEYVAEEAADVITAVTTMMEALGINAEMRDEAQRRVNNKNRSRGRL